MTIQILVFQGKVIYPAVELQSKNIFVTFYMPCGIIIICSFHIDYFYIFLNDIIIL